MALAAEKTGTRNQKGVEAAIGALAASFGNRLVTSQAVREQHGNTLTWIENQPPDLFRYAAHLLTMPCARRKTCGFSLKITCSTSTGAS